eukprot:TRINITY_DN45281_c0_g1_i1.p2 TRINITY_DN45281_c0_g1~~TRINITY_DN45281_c0_g1_i1.p2  ORF type:complete len:107 (+),score=6.11 TRINITY_DN45281_c0_g1_i1:51-323(+)
MAAPRTRRRVKSVHAQSGLTRVVGDTPLRQSPAPGAPQHFLYFLLEAHGHGSFGFTFFVMTSFFVVPSGLSGTKPAPLALKKSSRVTLRV